MALVIEDLLHLLGLRRSYTWTTIIAFTWTRRVPARSSLEYELYICGDRAAIEGLCFQCLFWLSISLFETVSCEGFARPRSSQLPQRKHASFSFVVHWHESRADNSLIIPFPSSYYGLAGLLRPVYPMRCN